MALVARSGVPADRELMLGTLFGGRPRPARRALGFVVHLGISGLFGAAYDAAFATLGCVGWKQGVLLSPAHYLVSGVFYAGLDRVHPLIPTRLPDPGPFLARGGAKGPVLLLLVKAAFGAAAGDLDRAFARRWK